MAILSVGADFPAARLTDTEGRAVEFPAAFSTAPATVVLFYRGRW
jgi:hypothetical protein